MLNDDGARERARAYLERTGAGSAPLEAIQGDASSRSYFRARLAARSVVLLVEPQTAPDASAPFLSIARFLEEIGLAPPKVLDQAADLGIVALEDLGEISLRHALEAAPAEAPRLFQEALEVVARLQSLGTTALTPAVHAYHVRFDEAVFLRELRMFVTRYLRDHARVTLPASDAEALDHALTWLAGRLAAAPAVLTHRDFHIDNLFVTEGRLRVIDFQDARWGPASYDPASLLTDRDVDRFIDAATARAVLAQFVRDRGLDETTFAAEYRLAVIERGLKATGTFADQALRRGLDRYLPFIPPTLRRVRVLASGVGELDPIASAIDRALERTPGRG